MRLEDRISKLSDKQKSLLSQKLKLIQKRKEQFKISCFYTSTEGTDIDQLSEKLSADLPSYMIPQEFIRVDELPRLPNGKIDHKQLLTFKTNSNHSYGSDRPLNKIESGLLEIWKEVLQNNHINVHDNFFQIGGDSISSIRIISKAKNKGLHLLPNHLFEFQTIEELAKQVQSENKTERGKADKYYGEINLSPIQLWFFEKFKNQPNYWNQAFRISFKEKVGKKVLFESLAKIVDEYDSLNCIFQLEASKVKGLIRNFTIDEFIVEIQNEDYQDELVNIQSQIDLEKGPLLRMVLINGQNDKFNSIILLSHHLVIDAVSWTQLIERFLFIVERKSKNNPIDSNAIIKRYKDWVDLLYSERTNRRFEKEKEFWMREIDSETNWESQEGIEEHVVTRQFALGINETSKLIGAALVPYNSKIQELILTAYLRSIFAIHRKDKVRIWLEHNGRELTENDHFYDTCGWFTSFYPLTFHDKGLVKESIISVKDKVRGVPSNGIGYGYLRYVAKAHNLRANEDFVFNYLGLNSGMKSTLVRSVEFIRENVRSSKSEIINYIELNCSIHQSDFECFFRFNSKRYDSSLQDKFLESFKENLKEVIDHCSNAHQQFTTSDFPDADLSDDDLNELLKQI